MAAVVVTGGTGALGSAVVRRLLADGKSVAVPFRDRRAWDALGEASGASPHLWGREADLSDPAATAAFMDEAAARDGGLAGLAAVAGAFAASGTVEEAPVAEWRSMMATNLDATWSACRAALPHLLRSRGTIVTVASRLAETGGAGSAAYAVSKSGVIALTRVLAQENRGRGVRVNCISPGTIDTPANRAAMPQADTSTWTPPDRLAALIVYLLSPESAPMTGAVLPADGSGTP
jgi:NAD(P)-dependent dehydrogenase (short-subunit alcohol dehydrogenase family)